MHTMHRYTLRSEWNTLLSIRHAPNFVAQSNGNVNGKIPKAKQQQ